MAEPLRAAPRMVESELIASQDRDPVDDRPGLSHSPAGQSEPKSETTSSLLSHRDAKLQPSTTLEAIAEPPPEAVTAAEPRRLQTLNEMLALVDTAWRDFLGAASALPSERMDEQLNEGWTRKQMFAHIAAWHDLTHDRLGKLILTGEAVDLAENRDTINARVARQAIGRTAGETLNEMEMTFNRLRRQLGRLTDEQLAADNGWAAQVIAANTYQHYDEHRADVYQPPPEGRSGRR